MNGNKQYFNKGLWILVLFTICLFTNMYANHTDSVILSYSSAIACFLLLLCLLMVLMQSKKTIDELNEDVQRLREREGARVSGQHSDSENYQQGGTFKVDETIARIMPANDVQFDSIETYTEKVLQNIAKGMNIVQGLIYVLNEEDQMFKCSGQYAYYSEEQPKTFELGETLAGQVAKNKETLNLKELPQGYITVLSGLGKSTPHNLIIAPIVHNDSSLGVIELASFKPFEENEELVVSKICELIGNRLNELRK